MRVIKLILATLLSIGLVLSPVATANAMASASAGLMASSEQATGPSHDKRCPCCDLAAKCIAAVCVTSCVQLAPAESLFVIELVGHAVLGGTTPSISDGLNQQPPVPPPRA